MSRAERDGAHGGWQVKSREKVYEESRGRNLIVLGPVATRDTVVNVGPIHATKDMTHRIPFGPVAGALVVIGGVV
ncbi:MAG TPA: hypothetical protein VEV37_04670 [Bryobacteraceae bacterium]|nr:hypothetical protein [Bryobacteraceae bacterium]